MPQWCNALWFLMSRHDEAQASGSSGVKHLASSKTFDHRLCQIDRSLLRSPTAHEVCVYWARVQYWNLELSHGVFICTLVVCFAGDHFDRPGPGG
jgi:hypothetical protein